jgi:hypothetical protein
MDISVYPVKCRLLIYYKTLKLLRSAWEILDIAIVKIMLTGSSSNHIVSVYEVLSKHLLSQHPYIKNIN